MNDLELIQDNFYSILKSLEDKTYSSNTEDLLKDITDIPHLSSKILFEGYISKRLREYIAPNNLLNIISYLEKHPALVSYCDIINKKIVNNVFWHKTDLNYLCFMYANDLRKNNDIKKILSDQIASHSIDDIMVVVEELSKYLNVSKANLLFDLICAANRNSKAYFQLTVFLAKLDKSFLYEIFCESLIKSDYDSLTIIHLIDDICYSSSELKKEISADILFNCDESAIAKALVQSTFKIQNIECLNHIMDLFQAYFNKLKLTIKHLCNKAELEGNLDFLLNFGFSLDKKKLLKLIIKRNDPELNSKFFERYGSCEEVKHLVPFI